MSTIPFTLAPGPDRRATADGRPVWTCLDDEDHGRLAETARMLGAALAPVEAAAAAEPRDDVGEIVAGLGEACAPAAHLYAHLTARRAVVVDDVGALRGIAGLAVVVTLADRVDVPLLRELSAPERDAVVGLCCAADAAQLRRQLLIRAAWAHVPPPPELDRIYSFIPDVPIGVETVGPVTHVGGAASVDDMATALSAGSQLVVMTTHSDGIDAKLGPGVLCSQPPRVHAPGPGAPFCQVHGRCHRLDLPLAEAWASGRLIAMTSVRARVVALNVCNGLLVAGNVVHPRHGLALGLLDSPSVGAVITTWDIGRQSPERHDAFVELLATGAACGAASTDYQRLPALAAWDERVVVLGDPRVRAIAPQDVAVTGAEPGDLGLLADLMGPIADEATGLARAPAARARELVGAIASGVRDPDTIGALQRAVFEVYTARSTWVSLAWQQLQCRAVDVDAHARCPHCARPARRFGHELTRLGLRRETIVCAACRMASDAPAGAPVLGVDVSRPGSVALRGEVPSGAAVHVVLRPPAQALSRSAPWPCDAAGRVVPEFAPELVWPRGPVEIAVLVMDGVRLSVFQRPVWSAGEAAA